MAILVVLAIDALRAWGCACLCAYTPVCLRVRVPLCT